MANFSLPSKNIKIIAIGLVVMILGFILMIGGGSSDPNVFNPAMFSFRRLTLAPIVRMKPRIITTRPMAMILTFLEGREKFAI